MRDAPLISCVMPTRNRRQWVPQSIACFLRQTYQPKELLILDNGEDAVADLVPDHPDIRYVHKALPPNMGIIRNECAEMALGELIAHWDDDDWYHPDRLLHEAWCIGQGAEIAGTSHVYLRRLDLNKAWLLRKPDCPPWTAPIVCDPSLLYPKTFWARNRFPELERAMEMEFLGTSWEHKIADLRAPMLCVLHIRYSMEHRRLRFAEEAVTALLDNVIRDIEHDADNGQRVSTTPWRVA